MRENLKTKDQERINIIIDSQTRKALEKIKTIGVNNDTTAIKMAVLHLAQHIEREEVFVDRGGNNLIQ
jgi:hypothetical protein